MNNKIHLGPKWPKSRYLTIIDGRKLGIRLRIEPYSNHFQIVIGYFDYKTDEFLSEEPAGNNLKLTKRKRDLDDLEADNLFQDILKN